MQRAQDRARSARSRKNGARSATIESRARGALKLASEASCARRECTRQVLGTRIFALILRQILSKTIHTIILYKNRSLLISLMKNVMARIEFITLFAG